MTTVQPDILLAENTALREALTFTWHDSLARLSPCPEAVEWARGYATLAEAWAACERGNWMLWLAGRVCPPLAGRPTPERARLVLAACDCAELARPHWTVQTALVCERALDLARRWARGDVSVSLAMLRDVSADAVAIAADAVAIAATAPASAAYATYAADASDAAAVAASAAAVAASAADAAVAASAATATWQRVLRECADLVRRHYPEPPVMP